VASLLRTFINAPQNALRSLIFDRISPRCGNDKCSTRNNLWPVIRKPSSGINLEGNWLCSPACLEYSAARLLEGIVPKARRWKPQGHRVPVGLLLLSRGIIRHDQLRTALKRQSVAGGGRLGHWLQEIGATTEPQLTAALAAQWACPVFPLERERSFIECATMLPMPLIESARMLPVYLSHERETLYVAFVDGVDYRSLQAAEHVLGCQTAPCAVSESAFDRSLEEARLLSHPEQFLFQSVKDPAEMAHITASFALQLQATSVRLTGCGEFAWVRFHSETVSRDLLFRLPIRPEMDGSDRLPQVSDAKD
jgi:Type II secretion system (T2SS), protein E, N-terminal domain